MLRASRDADSRDGSGSFKRGFTVPIGRWMAGPNAAQFRDEVLTRDAAVAGHIDIEELERRFVAHRQQPAHEHALWATWVLERWLTDAASTRGTQPPRAVPAV